MKAVGTCPVMHRTRALQTSEGGIDAGTAGRAGITECHITASLLVARAHGSDRVAATGERIEQRVELGPWQAEHRVDTIGKQGFDDRHAARHHPGPALSLVHGCLNLRCRRLSSCGSDIMMPVHSIGSLPSQERKPPW